MTTGNSNFQTCKKGLKSEENARPPVTRRLAAGLRYRAYSICINFMFLFIALVMNHMTLLFTNQINKTNNI